MALIVLCTMPVFASTPEQDMVLIVDEGDGDFSGLQQVSDEQLAGVEGNVFSSAADGASPITKRDIKKIFWDSERTSFKIVLDSGRIELIDVTYEQNADGSYTITTTAVGITSQHVISESDFMQIQIYAASHNMSITKVIARYCPM
jgi:hypothetical protein